MQYTRRLVKFKEKSKGRNKTAFLKKMKRDIGKEENMVGKPWFYGRLGRYLPGDRL